MNELRSGIVFFLVSRVMPTLADGWFGCTVLRYEYSTCKLVDLESITVRYPGTLYTTYTTVH